MYHKTKKQRTSCSVITDKPLCIGTGWAGLYCRAVVLSGQNGEITFTGVAMSTPNFFNSPEQSKMASELECCKQETLVGDCYSKVLHLTEKIS